MPNSELFIRCVTTAQPFARFVFVFTRLSTEGVPRGRAVARECAVFTAHIGPSAKGRTAMANPATDHLAQVRAGTTLNGKWHLDAVLGVGGMATVYAATHRNGYRAAVKMLHPLLSAQDAARERFLREGYIANKVEHRDAVDVLDEDVDEGGNVYLVMELLEGEPVSSRKRAAGGRLPVTESLWIAGRLLSVLEAAHAKGIVHRDIKPENLFLTSEGDLKVLDFGIARFGLAHTGNTLRGVVMGTPGFAAPEQVRGEWDLVDARADLFAVGATMFTLIVGKLIHEDATPYAQLRQIGLQPVPPVRDVDPTVPRAVARVIDRALSFRPEDRFPTATEMGRAVASAFVSLTGQSLGERLPEPQHVSAVSEQSEAAPTAISPVLQRESAAAPARLRKFRVPRSFRVALPVLAIGILGLTVGSKLKRSGLVAAPPNSGRAVLATGVVTAAPAAEMNAAGGAVESEPPATSATIPTESAAPPTPSTGGAHAPAPASSIRHPIAPTVAVAVSAVVPPTKPVTAGSQEASPPAAVGRPAEAKPARSTAGHIDFVETRH